MNLSRLDFVRRKKKNNLLEISKLLSQMCQSLNTTGSASVTGLEDKAAMHNHGFQSREDMKAELHHLDTH